MSKGAVQQDRSFHLPFRRGSRVTTMTDTDASPATDWQRRLDDLRSAALDELDKAGDAGTLEQWRITHLGRKSALSDLLGGMGKLPPDERKIVGSGANLVKRDLEQAFS